MLILPSLARPIAGFGLRARIIAVVSGTKVLAAPRLFLLDSHVRVAEHYPLDLFASGHIHHRLLAPIPRLALADRPRTIQRDVLALILSHASSSFSYRPRS